MLQKSEEIPVIKKEDQHHIEIEEGQLKMDLPKSQNSEKEKSLKQIPESGKIIPSSHIIEEEPLQIQMMEMSQVKQQDFQLKQPKVFFIEYGTSFSQIVKVLEQTSSEKNYQLQMPEPQKVLIKEYGLVQEIKKYFKFCFPLQQDREVYELKHLYPKNKAKLCQISGEENKFVKFKDYFCCRLWKYQQIQAEPKEAVRYFLVDKSDFLSLTRKQLQKNENLNMLGLKEKVLKVKLSEEILKKDLQNFIRQNMRHWAQKKLQQYYYEQICVYSGISKCLKKAQFENKKKNIMKRKNIKQIFQYLQLLSEYEIIVKLNEKQRPYNKPIKYLQEMKIKAPPSSLIEIISQFFNELKTQYNRYHKNQVKLIDDCANIQILSLCILLCSNTYLWQIVEVLLCYFQKQPGYMKEIKTLTVLKSAIEFINQKWQL